MSDGVGALPALVTHVSVTVLNSTKPPVRWSSSLGCFLISLKFCLILLENFLIELCILKLSTSTKTFVEGIWYG